MIFFLLKHIFAQMVNVMVQSHVSPRQHKKPIKLPSEEAANGGSKQVNSSVHHTEQIALMAIVSEKLTL